MHAFAKNILKSTCSFSLLLIATNGIAANRTVYYSQSGASTARDGLAASATGITCTITLVNQSTISQTYTVTAANSVTGTGSGAITASGDALSGTINGPGGTKNFTWTYPDFPASTAGTQNIVCAGTINVVDPGTNPGFVSANGTLVTFVEAGAVQSVGATGLSNTYGGQAVYFQTPILINGSRPF